MSTSLRIQWWWRLWPVNKCCTHNGNTQDWSTLQWRGTGKWMTLSSIRWPPPPLYRGVSRYLWTQTAWGHSWPSGVWSRARGSGPSLAEPRGEWKVKRKEEEDENSEKENGLETAIKYANQWTAYVTAATAIVWSRHSKEPHRMYPK